MAVYRYLVDSNGNYILDSNGDYIVFPFDGVPFDWENPDTNLNDYCGQPIVYTVEMPNYRRIIPLSLSVNWAQNEIAQFTFSVPRVDVSGDPSDYYLMDIRVLRNGETYVSGLIEGYDYGIENGIVIIKFRCQDELAKLTLLKAKSNAYYQNQRIEFILADLLDYAGDWEIGDVTTLLDPLEGTDILSTMDLRRDKETLWAQLVSALEATPRLFVRYGGLNPINGNKRLDFGYFGERSQVFVAQNMNLVSLTSSTDSRVLIREIEGYGGTVGADRITLHHALAYAPGLATHPTYPITIDANGNARVVNSAVTRGYSKVRYYSMHKASNSSPTTAELNEAGFALWQHVVRELEQNSTNVNYTAVATFPCEVFGTIYRPEISERVWLYSKVQEYAYNEDTLMPEYVETFFVEQLLRITKMQLDIQAGLETYQLTLTDNAYKTLDDTDNSVALYDQLTSDESSQAVAVTAMQVSEVTVSYPVSTPADNYYLGTAPDDYDAKEFLFAVPSVPGATKLYYAISLSDENYQYKILTPVPALPGTPLKLSVVDATLTWSAVSSLSITVIYMYV